MKTIILLILSLSLTVSAQQKPEVSPNQEHKTHLQEVLQNPESTITDKGFAYLFANLDQVKLEGPAAHKESIKSFVDNFTAFVSNMFDMFSFASDEEDEEPTNIDQIDSYNCDSSGNCHLALTLVTKEKRHYSFKVIFDAKQNPIGIKDNALIVK